MSGRKGLDAVEFGVRLPSGNFTRNIFKHIKDIPTMRKKFKNRGLYMSAYCYEDAENKSMESLLYGHLYIDLDIADLKDPDKENEAFDQIRTDAIKVISFFSSIFGIDEDMIRIYYSGQKGLHIIVPADIIGLQPMPELNQIFRLIALEINKMSKYKTVDTGIYDNARLFSLPNIKHPETGRHKIPLAYQELRTMKFQDIKRLSKNKRKLQYKEPRYNAKANRIFQTYKDDWEKEKLMQAQKSNKKYKKKLTFCPPCIESMLNRPCPQGFRNNTAAMLSSYYKQRGFTEEKAWKEIEKWNEEYANLNTRELSTTFNSIFHGEYEYGCSTLSQYGDCNARDCKIGQQRK